MENPPFPIGNIYIFEWWIFHCYVSLLEGTINSTGWWFQTFFFFNPPWGNDPIWLIFFKWVETTNYSSIIKDLCEVFTNTPPPFPSFAFTSPAQAKSLSSLAWKASELRNGWTSKRLVVRYQLFVDPSGVLSCINHPGYIYIYTYVFNIRL